MSEKKRFSWRKQQRAKGLAGVAERGPFGVDLMLGGERVASVRSDYNGRGWYFSGHIAGAESGFNSLGHFNVPESLPEAWSTLEEAKAACLEHVKGQLAKLAPRG